MMSYGSIGHTCAFKSTRNRVLPSTQNEVRALVTERQRMLRLIAEPYCKRTVRGTGRAKVGRTREVDDLAAKAETAAVLAATAAAMVTTAQLAYLRRGVVLEVAAPELQMQLGD